MRQVFDFVVAAALFLCILFIGAIAINEVEKSPAYLSEEVK